MRIAVFGLGYVGCVTGACLAKMGHAVSGVDISAAKVGMVNSGRSPVLEKGLEALVGRVVAEGKLRATLNPAEALKRADVSLEGLLAPPHKHSIKRFPLTPPPPS